LAAHLLAAPSVCVFRSRLLHPFSCARRLCPLPAALPANALKLVVSIGVFLLLTSIFGWVGVKYNHATCGRYTLGVYATILVILILMEWIAAGILFAFTHTLEAYVPSQVTALSPAGLMINSTFAVCCCPVATAYTRCDKLTPVPATAAACWVPTTLLYPCDSLTSFADFLEEWIDSNIIWVGSIVLIVSFLQLFTAITACCSQCRGKTVEQQKKIATGPVSYDGLYEGDENYAGYGYECVCGDAAAPARSANPLATVAPCPAPSLPPLARRNYVKGQPRPAGAPPPGVGATAGARPASAATAPPANK